MMHKTGLLIILLIISQSFVGKKNSFIQYYKALKVINLPLIFDCEKDNIYPDYSNIPEKLDKKFRPLGHKTFGRIDLNENVISIIQVAQAENEFPVIFNYNMDGKLLDSLCLLSGSCSSSPENRTHSFSSIGNDKIILMTDSCFYYKVDINGNRFTMIDSVVISVWQCIMIENGHFSKKLIKKVHI